MKFFWPWLMGAIEERQTKIAAGLAAASQSEKDLEEAEARSKEILREARDRAAQIVDLAASARTKSSRKRRARRRAKPSAWWIMHATKWRGRARGRVNN